jgi:fructose-bisphosphate aldolase, class I
MSDLAALAKTANALVAPRKGILAADESLGTIEKRLRPIGVENTEENRRKYRGLLFAAPEVEDHISGVILFDETLRQKTDDGTPFPKALEKRGIIPGIKVDKGAKPLSGCPGEKVTEGLDGLRDRLSEYYQMGARFAKWRAVITIGDGIPSGTCIHANAHALARYAALCQETGLVPIVEPEVLMDGDHSLARCAEVTQRTLQAVFHELAANRVHLEGILLKPNMVVPGKDHDPQASVKEVAEATLRVFRRAVPAAVPGIVFLSGGQSAQEATEHLDAMNRLGPHPWQLSFSYGRALQQPVLEAWGGKDANLETAKKAFHHRARLNGLAREGEYKPDLEREMTA